MQRVPDAIIRNKILLVSDFDHFLFEGLKKSFQKNGIEVNHIYLGKMGTKSRPLFLCNMAFAFFHIIFFSKRYDCVSYHYATKYMIMVDIAARVKGIRRVCTIWGSEFAKASAKNRKQLVSWYRTLGALSVTNKNFTDSLSGLNVHETSFGLSQFTFIEKNRSKYALLQKDKVNIVIGTNGSPNQQHLEILRQLALVPNDCLSKYHFIFPMSYGGDNAYRESIKNKAIDINISFSTIETVLNDDELSLLRLKTDILLQLQETDQLSGAMLESIFAGAHIITGGWLPYQTLDALNLKWSKINDFSELPEKLIRLLCLSSEEKERNKELISRMFSWEYRIKNWLYFLTET